MKNEEIKNEEKQRRGLRNLPKAILVISILWILGTLVWFPFTYWDPSQFVIYLVVGIGGIGFSIYSEWLIRTKIDLNKRIDIIKGELDELDKTVSSLANYTTKEFEAIINRLK